MKRVVFPLPAVDGFLLAHLRRLARRCTGAMGLVSRAVFMGEA